MVSNTRGSTLVVALLSRYTGSFIMLFRLILICKNNTIQRNSVLRQHEFFRCKANALLCCMKHVEHIGIAVKNLEASIELYTKLLGVEPYKKEEVESEGVITVFFDAGNTKIELLGATREDSPIAKFIEKRGEGIHHLAFAVENIRNKMKEITALDFILINNEPKDGADNKLIAFLHPKSTGNVLVEMCEDKR